MAWVLLSTRYGLKDFAYHKSTSATLTFRNGGADDLVFTCSEPWNTATPQFQYLDYVELGWDASTVYFGLVTRISRSSTSTQSEITYTVENVYAIWERTPWAQSYTLKTSTGSGTQTFTRNMAPFSGSQSVASLVQIISGFGGLAQSDALLIPNIYPVQRNISNSTVADIMKAALADVPRYFAWFTYPDAGKASYNVYEPAYYYARSKTINSNTLVSINYEQQDFNTANGVVFDYVTPWALRLGDVTSYGSGERQQSVNYQQEAWWGTDAYGGNYGTLNLVHREYAPRNDVWVGDWYAKTGERTLGVIATTGAYNVISGLGIHRTIFWNSTGQTAPDFGWENQTYTNSYIELDTIVNCPYTPSGNELTTGNWYPLIWGGPPSDFFASGTEGDSPYVVRARFSQVMKTNTTTRQYNVNAYLINGNHSAGKTYRRRVSHSLQNYSGLASGVYGAKAVPLVTGSLTCKRDWTSQFNGFAQVVVDGQTIRGVQQVAYDLNTDIVNITFGETSTLSPDDVIRTMRATRTT